MSLNNKFLLDLNMKINRFETSYRTKIIITLRKIRVKEKYLFYFKYSFHK
jgi:hypothetical protein